MTDEHLAYVPYTEYPEWQLLDWKRSAERYGDTEFAKVVNMALECIEADRQDRAQMEMAI